MPLECDHNSMTILLFLMYTFSVEGLLVEFISLRKSIREYEQETHNMKYLFCKNEDLMELKERIAYIEPYGKQVRVLL